MRHFGYLFRRFTLFLLSALLLLQATLVDARLVQAASPKITDENFVIREGIDFATRALRDPWDMSQFSDISQWFNHSGEQNYLLNFTVENGVFSALTASGLTYFIILYGGYGPGLRTGKIGAVYPIPSAQYQCFYLSMKADTSDPDHFQMEYGDEKMPQQVSGLVGLPLSNHNWKLYKIDLNTIQYIGTSWSNRANWQYMRVTPSLKAGTHFEIDWIRLTDCQPVNIRLKNLPNTTLYFYVRTGSPERQIQVGGGFTPLQDGSFDVDLQGVAPGDYTYFVKQTNGSIVAQGQISVQPAPIVNITHPSRLSGEDYAGKNSNPWDFNDWADVEEIRCTVDSGLQTGILWMDTLTASQSPSCVGSGVMNPIVFLRTLSSPSLQSYRYVSFRHTIDAAWSMPEKGMVVRWVWTVNRSGRNCTYYSKEFALDVGWQIYSADMYDDWNGVPAAVWPSSCPLVSWKNETGTIVELRFEPNENIAGFTLHQEVDWIRLTKVDQVRQGQAYRIEATLNIPAVDLSSITYYYTDDLGNPTQHQASSPPPRPPQDDPFSIFLPLLGALNSASQDPFIGELAADLSFKWDTSSVNPGLYSICALAEDGYNQSIYCSDAPIQVISP